MNDPHRPEAAVGWHPWIKDGAPLTRQPALLVVGGYRCGTTSLHSHLAGHPGINPATIKEPAFFFSVRWQDRPPIYPPGHEAQAYLAMFRRRSGRVLLESSATYLNDCGCAERIAAALPGARIVIALRDPIDRLVSWYKFRVFQGWARPDAGFAPWVEAQLADPRPPGQRGYFENALHHGRYASYVAEYLEAFGRERVQFVWFDELTCDPRTVMRRLCDFAGLDPAYYDTYGFPRQNESMKIRRPRAFRIYRAIHGRFFGAMRRVSPRLNFRLRELLFGVLEPRYLGLFTGPADPVTVPPALARALRDYYRPDLAPLAQLTGRRPPWHDRYTA